MKRVAKKSRTDLDKQIKEILALASKQGVDQNFFFLTTLNRYEVQIKILKDLENVIKGDGLTVTKEYVKGRENVYTHPAIGEYNKTATAANQTVQTLMKIIQSMKDKQTLEGDKTEADELMSFLGGRK